MTNSPDSWYFWSLGHKDADFITLMEDVTVRYNGSWKYILERRSVAHDRELQSALAKMENQGGVMCTEGMVSFATTHFVFLENFPHVYDERCIGVFCEDMWPTVRR